MPDVEPSTQPLRLAPFEKADDLEEQWGKADLLHLPFQQTDRYIVGFAVSHDCVERALRLRYEVFNLELNEGLAESALTGLDRDAFDDQMTHLVLAERESHRIVGTYRLQTVLHGLAHGGVYSAQEYGLSPLESYFDQTIELGRACLAQDHRVFRAMRSMWLGVGAFMNAFHQHYLFGCCSITSQDPDDGWRAMKTIRTGGDLHPELFLRATPEYSCGDPARENDPALGDAIPLPKLFRTYLRLGAQVISEPAIDRAFGTVDYIVFMDGRKVTFSQLDVVK